jgi:hypothetical protein
MTETRPVLRPGDTVNSLFRGWSVASPQRSDGHPDPLRLWRDHGMTCPDGWYVVRCRIDHSRKQALTLLVEMNPSRPDNPAHSHAPFTYRTLWYTPSPEHAGEVARQLAAYERKLYYSYDGYIHELYRKPCVGMDWSTGNPGDPYKVGWSWSELTVHVQVYQRCGDTPRVVSVTPATYLKRPRAM